MPDCLGAHHRPQPRFIVALTAFFGIAATLANVIATCTATVPSYHLNRRWTWGRRDRSDAWRKWILQFIVLDRVLFGSRRDPSPMIIG